VKKRRWRVLVPTLVTVGLMGAAVPAALAGELDHDRDNNKLNVRMSLHCNSDRSVTLNWHSLSPRVAVSMTAKWYDLTADPDLRVATPSAAADQAAAVSRRNGKASGRFVIRHVPRGHKIALFVDALDGRNGEGNQVFGLGRNIDTVRC
jgi:hypothetical protein